ncbi:MAG: ATPase, T2SS/T4P/T4SS family [Thermoanaerobacterales bacterium]|nr:ATPase, T2SS/T4P/T4SS family [Thermoanaerobacterales bacterium]
MKLKPGQDFLGTRLVEAGVITPEQLQEALKKQTTRNGTKERLGRILVRLGYCTEDDIARVLGERAGVPFLSLESFPVNAAAAATISPETARRYRALPIAFEDNRLVVAMMRPDDVIAIDNLRILTGYDIQPVTVPDSELEAAIERFSRTGAEVEAGVEEEPVSEVVPGPENDTTDKPAVHLANLIFSQAVSAGASDVHIDPQEKGVRVRFRIDGVLHDVMHPPRRLHPALVSRIKVLANMDIAERRVPQDGRMTLKIEGKTVDVRVATLPGAYGEKVTLRLLDRTGKLITLDELGFAPPVLAAYREGARLPYGFILVTGPTGSGKSTTLYATLAALNSTEKNIITVEDPIEYRIDGVNQIQINPRAGLTFATGLRSILRSDPDIVMIGEIRDQETARIAVESALTGHLVLSTLHTNDAAGAITRLGDMGIEPFLTASSLVCILAQRLVRVLCLNCKEPYELPAAEWRRVAGAADADDRPIRLYRPRGCLRCSNTGYRGRIGVYELLRVTEPIRRLTLARRSAGEIKEAAVAEGMVTLFEDGLLKVKKGITSLEEVMRVII